MAACTATPATALRGGLGQFRIRPSPAVWSLCLSIAVFGIQYTAVIAGIVRTPRGFAPAWMLREQDICQYFTWILLGQKHWLLPDYHAPWLTAPALLQPLFLLEARIVKVLGANPLAVYYVVQFLLLWLAVWSFVYALNTFCPTRGQRMAASSLLVCCLPIPLFIPRFTTVGIFQYAYLTADGLSRGGIMASPTLSLGTAISLLGMSCLARFVRDHSRRHLVLLWAILFVGTFVHPFEPILVATTSVVAFLLYRGTESVPAALKRGAIALLLVAGGMLPHLYLSFRTPWLRAVANTGHSTGMQHILWTPEVFGIPAALVIYFLLLRPRLTRATDGLLQIWFLAAPLLALIPQMPLAVHLFDGYACCITMLLVRYACDDKLLRSLVQRRPGLMRAAFGIWVGASVCIAGAIYLRIAVEARAPEPSIFPRTIISADEQQVLQWMRTHAGEDDLALAPLEMSYSLAALPMHAFASHYNFSITFGEQRAEQERFSSGRMSGPEQARFLTKYGIRYVILAPGQRLLECFSQAVARAAFDGWRIYEFPQNHMREYGGKMTLGVSTNKSQKRRPA